MTSFSSNNIPVPVFKPDRTVEPSIFDQGVSFFDKLLDAASDTFQNWTVYKNNQALQDRIIDQELRAQNERDGIFNSGGFGTVGSSSLNNILLIGGIGAALLLIAKAVK